MYFNFGTLHVRYQRREVIITIERMVSSALIGKKHKEGKVKLTKFLNSPERDAIMLNAHLNKQYNFQYFHYRAGNIYVQHIFIYTFFETFRLLDSHEPDWSDI